MKLILNFSTGEYDDFCDYHYSLEASSKEEVDSLFKQRYLECVKQWEISESTFHQHNCVEAYGLEIEINDLFIGPWDFPSYRFESDYAKERRVEAKKHWGEPNYDLYELEEFWRLNLPR